MNYQVPNIYPKIKRGNIKVSVPGSKSLTVRALLIAALAHGVSVLHNVQLSDDCATFLNCLRILGIEFELRGTSVIVKGCEGKIPVSHAHLDVGSSGTAARFLIALLAFSEGEFTVDCSVRMKQRPIQPLIQSLISAGASIISKDGNFPLQIRGRSLASAEIEVDITSSSQFLSALLMAGVCVRDGLKIKTRGFHGLDYVDMTIGVMRSFGVTVVEERGIYMVNGEYAAAQYEIEPDVSSACYFYAANKILGTRISVNGIMAHSCQGDIKFIELLETFNGGAIDMSRFSDQALTLAAIAPYLAAPTEIYGISHIRLQECDRIKAMEYNLSAMGVPCEISGDGIKIYPSPPKPATIKTFGDHRVAMAFAITGLRAKDIIIENAEVCAKSFKDYFSVLDRICNDLTI